MGKGLSTTEMEIIIKENMLMECLKDAGNIYGMMEACIRVILNKEKEVVMGFGRQTKINHNLIEGITVMIRKPDTGFSFGRTAGAIKEISITITEMAMASFIRPTMSFITRAFGIMDSLPRKKNRIINKQGINLMAST